jgi:hypothetical protein
VTPAAASSQIQERFGIVATVTGAELGVVVPTDRWQEFG